MTPLRAIVLTSTIAAVLIVALPNIEELAKIASSLQLYSYAAINVGAVALRVADPPWYRPSFRVPLTPFPQLVGALGCLAIIGFSGTTAQLAVLALIAISLAWYGMRRSGVTFESAVPRLRARWGQLGLRALFAPPTAVEVEAAEGPIAALERITGAGDPRRVAVALANPRTEQSLLRLGRLIATGSTSPGEVLAVRLVEVPRLTPLGAVDKDAEVLAEAREQVDAAIRAMNSPGEGLARPVDAATAERVVVPTHDIANGLVDQTLQHRGDMLVLGWHGGFSLGRIADSPVRRVVADLPADFAVLRERDLGAVRRVLLPWGGGRHARLGLEVALRLVGPVGGRIDLLRAVREDVDAAREERKVRDEIAALVQDAEVDVRVLVERSDDVVRTITDVAESGEYDLLVIGASGETGLRSVLFGTIPDIVADRVPCSVLLIRRFVPGHWAYRASDRFKRLREQAGLTSSAE